MIHIVLLNNGEKIVLEERDNALSIRLFENGDEGPYICEITPDGTTVYGNSGWAPEVLTRGLVKSEGKFEYKPTVPRQWVACMPTTKTRIATYEESDFLTAKDAFAVIKKDVGGLFDLYFQTSSGALHSVNINDRPEQFLDE